MKRVNFLKKVTIVCTALTVGTVSISAISAQTPTGSGAKFTAPSPNYRGMSASVEETYKEDVKKEDIAEYTYTIGENADGDLQVSTNGLEKAFADLSFGYGNGEPNDVYRLTMRIVNNSSHVYQYKNESLTIAPVNRQDGIAGIVGFDGQNIAKSASSIRNVNVAVMDLFKGKTPSFEQMMGIYDVLAKTKNPSGGTYTGNEALTNYYLDYFNKLNGTNVSKLEDFDTKTMSEIVNNHSTISFKSRNNTDVDYVEYQNQLLVEYGDYMKENAVIDNISKDKKNFEAFIYESEPQISALAYDYFYNNLYSVSINGSNLTSFGDMMRKGDAYQNNTKSLDSINLKPQESTTISISIKASFNIANPYMIYTLGTYFAFDLDQMAKVAVGNLIVNNLDEDSQLITDTSSYLISKTENDLVKYFGKDGNWTSDIHSAGEFYSENGSFNVANLPYGTYTVQQSAAPKGYETNANLYTVLLDKDSASVQIVNKKITNIEPPVQPETPIPPQQPEPPVNPIVPVTPILPVNPIVPFTPIVVLPQANIGSDTPLSTETVIPKATPQAKKEIAKETATPKSKGTGDAAWALINLICAVITVLFALILLLAKHRKDDEEDEKDQNLETVDQTSEENELPKQRRRWTKVLAVIIALIAVILFILTEDIRLPMIWIDEWTLWMVVIAVIQLIVFIIGRRWKEIDDETEAESVSVQA